MKTKNRHYIYGFSAGILAMFLGLPGMSLASQANAPVTSPLSTAAPIDESNPQTDILAAEERFKQAEKAFEAADNAQARAALAANGQNATAPAGRENSFMAPAANTPIAANPAPAKTNTSNPNTPKPAQAPRQDIEFGAGPNYYGSPETGYSATWKEQGSGDVMTSVIAPSEPVQTTPVYPMIIEPLVNGYDWNGQNYGSSGGWNGNYPPFTGPGFDHGGYYPPPNHNYRPLRPNNPSLWHPGEFGPGGHRPWHPGQPGWGPGFQPPYPPGPPQGGWGPDNRPGFGPGDRPGFNPPPGNRPGPGNPPGVIPPPMPGPGNQPGLNPPPPPGNRPGFGPGNQPGFNPPPGPGNQPGFNPPPVPGPGNQPGFNPPPPPNRPPSAPGFGPGANMPGGRPGFIPMPPGPRPGGMPATMRPLPMSPAGNTWGRPGPMPGRPHGGF